MIAVAFWNGDTEPKPAAEARPRCGSCGAYAAPRVPLVLEVDARTGEETHRCVPCFSAGRHGGGTLRFTTLGSGRPATAVRGTVGLVARVRQGLGFRT